MTRAEAWAELHRHGHSMRLIAAAAGVAYSTVRLALIAQGVPATVRGPYGSHTPWHRDAARLREQGYSFHAIGRQFGVSHVAVIYALRRLAQ